MKLALVLALAGAPAFATELSNTVEVTAAIIESPDGSVCYVDATDHGDILPPQLHAAPPITHQNVSIPACGADKLKDISRVAGQAIEADSAVSALSLEGVVPAVCGFAFLTGVGNAARAITERGEPLAIGDPSLHFGSGAGFLVGNLANVTLRGIQLVPGMGVIGAACSMVGEWATYQVYYLVVPKKS